METFVGKSVEEAVQKALNYYNLKKEELDITIQQEAKGGFLGIGQKDAIIKAVPKNKIEHIEATKDIPVETTAKKENVLQQTNVKPQQETGTKIEPMQKDISLVYEDDYLDQIKSFVEDIFEKIDIEYDELEVTKEIIDKEVIQVSVSGKDSSLLIGRHGSAMQSLQYLLNTCMYKQTGISQKIILNIENYRQKRQNSIEKFAQKMANKATVTRRPIKLEPMSPYERRIVHEYLSEIENITTYSEGKDPYRRIVIKYEK